MTGTHTVVVEALSPTLSITASQRRTKRKATVTKMSGRFVATALQLEDVDFVVFQK